MALACFSSGDRNSFLINNCITCNYKLSEYVNAVNHFVVDNFDLHI
jgi:hypothetical protein